MEDDELESVAQELQKLVAIAKSKNYGLLKFILEMALLEIDNLKDDVQ
jgi:deoxyribose-phosphate aldolase